MLKAPALGRQPIDLPIARAPAREHAATTGWWPAPRTAGVIFGSLGLVAIGAGSALVASGDSGGHVDRSVTLGGISIVTGGRHAHFGLGAAGERPDAAQHARVRVTPTLAVAQNATVLGAVGQF